MTLQLSFTKVHSDAKTPERFEEGSVGYDLFSTETKVILPLQIGTINTGIVFKMQGSYCGYVKDKSGYVTKKRLMVVDGVIDPADTTPVLVHLYNVSDKPQTVFAFEKIAQIVFQNILLPKLVYKSEIDTNTFRGTRGFGGE